MDRGCVNQFPDPNRGKLNGRYNHETLYGLQDIRSHDGKFYIGGYSGRLFELDPEVPTWRNLIVNNHLIGNGGWLSPSGWIYVAGQKYFVETCSIFRTQDGSTIEYLDLPETDCEYLTDVWGFSDDDIWACGTDGYIFHYDGSSWNLMNKSAGTILRGIWGTDPDNVYIVGDWSTIYHWDGANLQKEAAPTSGNWYYSAWGTSRDDIYIVGDYQTIVHYNGTDWSVVMTGGSDEVFNKILGTNMGEMYVMGEYFLYSFDGSSLTSLGPGVSGVDFVNMEFGPNGKDLYLANFYGSVFVYSNDTWHEEVAGTEDGLWDIVVATNSEFLVGTEVLLEKAIP